jgi:hypothetical protein
MGKVPGPKLNVSLARAAGCFRQTMGMLLDSAEAGTLDSETMDTILEFEDSLKQLEQYIYTKRHPIFWSRVVMFDDYDLA